MPYCPECGAEIGEHAQFCPECGAQLAESEKPPRKTTGFSTEDFLTKPELIMAIAGIIFLVSSVGPWHGYWHGYWPGTYGGWLASGIRASVAFMGLIMLYSTAVELGYVDFLENMVPVLSVSAICGSVVLIGSLFSLTGPLGGGWGLYLALIGSLVALFATFRAWERI